MRIRALFSRPAAHYEVKVWFLQRSLVAAEVVLNSQAMLNRNPLQASNPCPSISQSRMSSSGKKKVHALDGSSRGANWKQSGQKLKSKLFRKSRSDVEGPSSVCIVAEAWQRLHIVSDN